MTFLSMLRAGNLQYSNHKTQHDKPGYDDTIVENAHHHGVLIDPEDYTSGSLHRNISASVKPKRRVRRRLQASDGDSNVGTLDNDTVPTPQVNDVTLSNGHGPKRQMSIDIDATSNDDDEGDLDFDGSDDPFGDDSNLDDGDLGANTDKSDTFLANDQDDDDEAEDDEDFAWDQPDDTQVDTDFASVPVEATEKPDQNDDPNATPILDLIEDTTDIKNLAFVIGANNILGVMVGKNIVATLTKENALTASVGAHYTSPSYHKLLAGEIKKHGLRAALMSNGFKLNRINLRANAEINKLVKDGVEEELAVRERKNRRREAAMDQSVAIAAVGMNRNFFKGTDNSLRKAIAASLQQAGVQNPNRVAATIMAKHGHTHIKSALELAAKIADQSDEVRKEYSEALDLTSDIIDDGEDEGHITSCDTSITASLLSRPNQNTKQDQQAAFSLDASARAAAILSGELPIF